MASQTKVAESIIPKRTPTTKDVALLQQLHQGGQLILRPEFQRNSVWPKAAKAYLIDTILNEKPIPMLFFQRSVSAQTGRSGYAVIDGQQRLRAIFEFLEDRFRLTESGNSAFHNKKFSQLPADVQTRLLNYDLVVEELSNYSDADIRDMFVRMNKYVVKLSSQELRNAREKGAFKNFVLEIGELSFWKTKKVFSELQLKRMRAVEFAAELTILLVEGPQDKKSTIDLYYAQYRNRFPYAASVRSRLERYLNWVARVFPDMPEHRYRKPVDLYGLIGAIDQLRLSKMNPERARAKLLDFEKKTLVKEPMGDASKYVLAASRQTDNIGPRTTRIEILASLLRGLYSH
jgi:hypothetical protein